MDEISAAAKRHLTVLEGRIARQSELIQRPENAGRDATESVRNLELMQQALASMRATLHELAAPNAPRTGAEAVGMRKRRSRRRASEQAE
jgi:hypothetical protein